MKSSLQWPCTSSWRCPFKSSRRKTNLEEWRVDRSRIHQAVFPFRRQVVFVPRAAKEFNRNILKTQEHDQGYKRKLTAGKKFILSWIKDNNLLITVPEAVLRIRIRVRIRIHMFLGLLDSDPSVRGMDPDPDPSLTKQKKEEKPRFLLLCDFFLTFYLCKWCISTFNK